MTTRTLHPSARNIFGYYPGGRVEGEGGKGIQNKTALPKNEIRELLIGAARARNSLSYSQTLMALGHRFTRPLMRQLCKVLDAIDEDGRAVGEPGLAVLVVRESDGMPGQGWFVSRSGESDDFPTDWGKDGCGPKARAYVKALQTQAFEYWSER
ncbi:MAG: ribose-phosphate pyrophosphokinase [Pseudomonadota bacterium]